MKRILVIDDDMQLRQMLKQMLERQGYDVVEAQDGKEGLNLYRQAPTDLVITDIIMPEKEGVETIIELKRDFPDVKIIAISGGSRGIDSTNCLYYVKQFGADYIFAKPFDRKILLEAVQELLGEVAVS
jgi:CheY-like chemotaxis protein